jgi:hypothetical protein
MRKKVFAVERKVVAISIFSNCHFKHYWLRKKKNKKKQIDRYTYES